MEQYILKSALVAEIERRRKDWRYGSSIEAKFKREECDDILSFLNTLEVKEVDLEKEIQEVQRNYKTIEEYEGYPCTMYAKGIEWIARHFFELGLKTKGE